MIKEAIDKILALAPIQTKKIDERNYTKDRLTHIAPPEYTDPHRLDFHTLTGMIDHIKAKSLLKTELFLLVDDHSRVSLCGAIQPDNYNKRFIYAVSSLVSRPFAFGTWWALEEFIISLQSQFVQTDITEKLIQHLGHLANETVTENKDDGFSQSYQIKTGVTTKAEVQIENPMVFQPYRTFMEIDQPSSQCVFRLRTTDGMQCKIVEADGDQWKLGAIQSIKKWLGEQLPNMTIIA